jgi:hypothetical protein
MLQIRDGRVTLDARDVPVAEILAEWTRVGETRIVNANRVKGPPLTLRLVNVAERDALKTILRDISGYITVVRAAGAPGASAFDRILVLATSSGTPPAATASTAASPGAGQPRGSAAAVVPLPRNVAHDLGQAAGGSSAPATNNAPGSPALDGNARAASDVLRPSPAAQGVRNFARRPPGAPEPEEQTPTPPRMVPSFVPGLVGGQVQPTLGSTAPGLLPPSPKP